MAQFNRRDFLKLGGVGAAALGVGGCQVSGQDAASGGEPDLVLLNGRIYTVDEAQPRAEALAVKHGRFLAVGSNDDVRNLVTARTEVIDAAGMIVTPGFIDAHSHPNGVRELTGVNVDMLHADSCEMFLPSRCTLSALGLSRPPPQSAHSS